MGASLTGADLLTSDHQKLVRMLSQCSVSLRPACFAQRKGDGSIDMHDLTIRNATIIDGSGAPVSRAILLWTAVKLLA